MHGRGCRRWEGAPSTVSLMVSLFYRSSMSGLHLVKQGRDRKKIDSQRDFTVASPAEFVTRFGGNKVIEKVSYHLLNCFSRVHAF